MMSHAAITPNPAPSAAPFTAAMTGMGHSRIEFAYSRAVRLCRA
jgi:hypothetical protein